MCPFGTAAALLLALGRPAAAQTNMTISVGTSMVSPGSYNRLSCHLSYSGTGGGSDTQSTDLSGNQTINLNVTSNLDGTMTVNGFAFQQTTPGNVNLTDLHWHWTYLIYNIWVNSSGVSGTGRTVPTFSTVTGGSFPTDDHHFVLNNGSVQPSTDAPGQSLSGVNLASSPMDTQTTGQQGQVTMTSNGDGTYTVTWTMPVNFTQNLDANTSLSGNGTLQATGQYPSSSPSGANYTWIGNNNGWDSANMWYPNGNPGIINTVAHLNGKVMFLQDNRFIDEYGYGGGVVGQIVGCSDWSTTYYLSVQGNFYMRNGTLGPNLELAHVPTTSGHLLIGNGGNVLLNCDNEYSTTDSFGTEIGWVDSGAGLACTVKLGDWRALNQPAARTHVFNNSTLDLNGVSGVRSGGIVMDPGTSLLNNSGNPASTTGPVTANGCYLGGPGDLTLSAGVFGQGFTKTGADTVSLGADSGCTGSIAIAAGTLQVGTGGGGGTLGSASVVNNGLLVFNRAGTCVVPGSLSGPGQVSLNGPGTIILTGANSFGGMTYGGIAFLNAGTLQVGAGGTSGTLGSGPVLDNGALVFNRADTLLVANLIGGVGTVSQNGTGTLVLSGGNAYSGGTTLSAGTLAIGSDSALGTGGLAITGPATLCSDGTTWRTLNLAAVDLYSDVTLGDAANNGVLTFQSSPWTLQTTPQITVSSPVVIVGPIGGSGLGLTKAGAGTLMLGGTNTYSGPTTISGGTLQLGAGGTSGSLASTQVLDNAALSFNRSDALTFAGNISGSGDLTQGGAGTVVLGGSNTYTGTTEVSAGTLVVSGSHSAGSGTYTVDSGATLRVDGSLATSGDVTVGGTLGGTGELEAYVTVLGTLAPRNAGGSLVVSDTLALLGTTVMEVNHDGPLPTSDCVIAGTLYSFSSLVVTNTGVQALRAGDRFNLFYWMDASVDFNPIKLPPLSPGLAWSNHLATDGALSVIGQAAPLTPRFGAPVLSGSTLTLAGTGGVAGGTYYVLSSTNLAAPRANWTAVATNTFDASGGFSFTPTVDPAQLQQFYLIAVP